MIQKVPNGHDLDAAKREAAVDYLWEKAHKERIEYLHAINRAAAKGLLTEAERQDHHEDLFPGFKELHNLDTYKPIPVKHRPTHMREFIVEYSQDGTLEDVVPFKQ